MILFFEKTWALWWIVAVGIILYWFCNWSADTESESVNAPFSAEEARTVPGQAATGNTTPPFVDGTWF
jgi:hypothetical protein